MDEKDLQRAFQVFLNEYSWMKKTCNRRFESFKMNIHERKRLATGVSSLFK
jgi:hypothetical protein